MPDNLVDASYKYYLVEFINSAKEGTRDIEILPQSWIDGDDENSFMAYFPPPPYTAESSKKIQSMISQSADIDPSWDTFEVHVRGRAKTLTEARKKLTLLKRCETVMTTDGEGQSQLFEKELHNALKARKEHNKMFEKKNLKMFDDDEDDYSANSSQELDYSREDSSDGSSISPREPALRNKKYKTAKKAVDKTQKSTIYPQHTTKDFAKKVESAKTLQRLPKSDVTRVLTPKPCTLLKVSKPAMQTSKGPQHEPEINNLGMKTFSALTGDRKLDPELQKLADFLLPKIDQIVQMHTQPLEDKVAEVATKFDSICLEQEKRKYDVVNAAEFGNKYEIQLPIHTLEQFNQFDEKLLDKQAAQDLENSMVSSFDSNKTISRNITNILKICMKKEVAVNFTALKKSGCKRVLVNTNFYKVLEAFLLMAYKAAKKDTNQSAIHKALSEVMTNTIDWDGGRKNRKSMKPAELEKEGVKEQ